MRNDWTDMTTAAGNDHRLARARQLLEFGAVDRAIAELRELLALEPENADARAQLARAFLAAGNVKLALEHGQAALALDPENQLAHIALAEAYLGGMSRLSLWGALASRKKARSHVDFLLAASPEWAPYHRLKARVDSVFGRKAVDTLEASLSLDPEDPATWSALGAFQFRQGNIAAAERAARQALALNPEDRSSLFVMGMVALSERRFDEARDNALSILRRWPKDVEAMSLLASAKMADHRLLGMLFRGTAACMRLERTRYGKLSYWVMLGVYFLLLTPWDENPGLTPTRVAALALMAASILAVLPSAYLQGFLIQRELSRARKKTKLRADY